jgi:hypothetical protein
MKVLVGLTMAILFLPAQAPAQNDASQTSMPGMQMGNTNSMQHVTFIDALLQHDSSGTSAQPISTPIPMLMKTRGAWTLMFHAVGFAIEEQQTSSRGGDKFFSTNWLMPMASRKIGKGAFTVRTMLSMEPATVTGRQYPLLFQQGETAYGKPIADGQHPHNFVMELAAMYDVKLGTHALVSFYAAPVGDPAIGPTAYPHRASAAENPVATLGHHQEDSTHISDDVVTAGFAYSISRVEASGFHGREPDENRWTFSQGAIDSWSARITLQPDKNWSGQYSYAQIHSPEALYPMEDQERMTASVMYNRAWRNGNWANAAVWGRTRSPQDGVIFNSYLLESTVRFRARNYFWTRIENADRSNELILGENPLPANFLEKEIGHVQAYTFGYDREFNFVPRVASAIGAQVTLYTSGQALQAIYGSHPVGALIFVRVRATSKTGK